MVKRRWAKVSRGIGDVLRSTLQDDSETVLDKVVCVLLIQVSLRRLKCHCKSADITRMKSSVLSRLD